VTALYTVIILPVSVAYPGESEQYRAARERLLQQEAELRRAIEAVAAARRELPPGGELKDDYVFQEAGPADVRFSELFAPGKDTLAIYSFMFPRSPDEQLPCPSCTQFLDSFDGVVEHASQRINVAVVAKIGLRPLLAHAKSRGWRHLRLLSSAGNRYNADYLAEAESGAQLPMLNVFRRDEGGIRHFWGSELMFAPPEPGQDPRQSDTIDPLWNLFDLTPDGRGSDWDPQLTY
jgi:predicted dithiol-disulfide oxidoreductase (DUF899 family)